MWKPTPEQLHNVDLLIASVERRKREFRDRIKLREMMSNEDPWASEREEVIITNRGVSRKTIKLKHNHAPIPPHQCKVDYYTTTDQDGRTWIGERRH